VYTGHCVTRCWGTSDARWGCENRGAVQLCELRGAGAIGSSVGAIRKIVNAALTARSPEFEKLYAKSGRPSIPSEKLLRALLLQAFYSVRSERQLIDYNLLFRWFVGLSLDAVVWDVTVFTKNRERLIAGDIAAQFMAAVLNQQRVRQAFGARGSAFDRRHVPAMKRRQGDPQTWSAGPETDAPGGSVPRRGENHGAAVNDRRFAVPSQWQECRRPGSARSSGSCAAGSRAAIAARRRSVWWHQSTPAPAPDRTVRGCSPRPGRAPDALPSRTRSLWSPVTVCPSAAIQARNNSGVHQTAPTTSRRASRCALHAAGPFVPGKGGTDMIRASPLACSGDSLLGLAICQGKNLIAEGRRGAFVSNLCRRNLLDSPLEEAGFEPSVPPRNDIAFERRSTLTREEN
jgi:hypothetical protein